MSNILFIVGSPKKKSFNLAFSKLAYEMFENQAEIRYLDFHDLPFMSPDLEHPRPHAVEKVMKEVTWADGLWIFASEYNLSCSAYLKNLLDWLSRPTGDFFDNGTYMTNKKVTLSSVAGRSAGKYVLVHLNQMLNYMGANVMKEDQTGVGLPVSDFEADEPHFQQDHLIQLERQGKSFLSFLNEK